MFLFASLTVGNLEQQPRLKELKEELREKNFPHKLKDA
jgi:hypothetical protein